MVSENCNADAKTFYKYNIALAFKMSRKCVGFNNCQLLQCILECLMYCQTTFAGAHYKGDFVCIIFEL